MDLQKLIDDAEDYGTLSLPFNEYFGQIVIRKPITIDGNLGTICAKQGPVVSVESGDVQLKNIRLEVTSVSLSEDSASLALRVAPDTRVRLQHIVVKGNATGVVNEDGVWNYPDVIHIWPVVPEKKNFFEFEMDVPVSCALETEIEGVNIANPALQPGRNKIRIEVAPLKDDIILFGEIEIKSTYLRRIISVSGGTFGIPENVAEPKQDRPILLGDKTRPELRSDKPESLGPKPQPHKKSRFSLIPVFVAICLVCAGIAWFFLKNVPSPKNDVGKPTCVTTGIKSEYTKDEEKTVDYALSAKDDQSLKSMTFSVKNTSVRETWDLSGKSAEKKSSFPTAALEPGKYEYAVEVTDDAGNSEKTSGFFSVAVKTDTEQPILKITGNRNIYERGETVGIAIEASDDRSLEKIDFQVKRTSITASWDVNGRFASKTHSFSTDKLSPGTYGFVCKATDRGGNVRSVEASFDVREIEIRYGYLNVFTRPWMKMYVNGEYVGRSPIANLKLPAGKVTIRFVNETRNIDEKKEIVIEPEQTIKKRFEWQ